MRIEHANISVSDLNTSVDFYRRLLGAELRWRGLTDAGQQAAHVGGENTYLALFEAPESDRATANYMAVGFNHLGFEVDGLDVYRQRLKEMDVPLKGEESYKPGRRMYFYDPDGIEIELVEYQA